VTKSPRRGLRKRSGKADTLGMSMHEVICATCGAINQADAEICWRCLAALRKAPAPAAAADGTTKIITRSKA
jgi:hypothetical protein